MFSLNNAARSGDPTTSWVFQDSTILSAVIAQASRLLIGAAEGREGFPTFAGTPLDPSLAQEVIVRADGSAWRYADEVDRPLVTPGAVAVCDKCGDLDRVEGVFHVALKTVYVEFAFCVGCMASHVACATRAADALGVPLATKAVR